MMWLLTLLGDWWQPLAGLIAAGFAAVVWRNRKQEGRVERDAEIAAANVEIARAQAEVVPIRSDRELTDRLRRGGL